MTTLRVPDHPLLDVRAFVTTFDGGLEAFPSNDALRAGLSLEFDAPLRTDDTVKKSVRDLLRVGGFKPSGRSKPASEYLIRAASRGELGTINAAVDACNVASLHSGVPISVIDLDLAEAPLSIALAPAESEYVFNASGQVMSIAGLWCVSDAQGPCANAVKDSQRTKTQAQTRRTLSVLWCPTSLEGRADATLDWYRSLLEGVGAPTDVAQLERRDVG